MSTKIYDAYKFKCENIKDLVAFRKELTKLYYEYCYNTFVQICAVKLLSLTERLPLEASKNQERADGIIKTIGSLVDRKRMSQRQFVTREPNIDFETAAGNLKANSLIGSCTRAALSLFEDAEDSPYNDFRSIKGSFAVYEYVDDPKYCLIMVFGSNFAHFVSNLIWKPENLTLKQKEFVAKWEIVDFHYQNQTDQPDDISDDEWEAREEAWDAVMDTSVPREDAVIVNLYSAEQFDHDVVHMLMFEQPKGSKYYDKITNDIIACIKEQKSDRADRNGYEDARDEYISVHPDFKACDPKSTEQARIVSRLSREFKQLCENKDEQAMDLVKKHTEAYEKFIIDFEDPDIQDALKSENVFDFTDIEAYAGFKKPEDTPF